MVNYKFHFHPMGPGAPVPTNEAGYLPKDTFTSNARSTVAQLCRSPNGPTALDEQSGALLKNQHLLAGADGLLQHYQKGDISFKNIAEATSRYAASLGLESSPIKPASSDFFNPPSKKIAAAPRPGR